MLDVAKKKTMSTLAGIPMLKDATAQLLTYLASVATIETYDSKNPIIPNGDHADNFDFLYVVRGNIEFTSFPSSHD